jgi:hypothetical protein
MDDRGRSIAVMQPYIFPYLGYFQLINAVDEFVFYDDVNFIKQGWINRNQILNNNKALGFSIPLEKASSFETIQGTKINFNLYAKWKKKFLKTLEQNYYKATYFESIYDLVREIIEEPKSESISELAIRSNVNISNYLGLKTKFKKSSEHFYDSKKLERTERLLNICNKLKAKAYVNALGGQELYNKSDFKASDIDLYFLKPNLKTYKQFSEEFVPGLSIIDILMFNSKEECIELLNDYKLV